MRNQFFRWLYIITTVLLLTVGAVVWSLYFTDWNYHITVSKETTYITEPLLPDGRVDYVTAINEILSQGVSPENNAAIPFIRELGFDDEKTVRRKSFPRFCLLLGVSPDRLEPKGGRDRFKSLYEAMQKYPYREGFIEEMNAVKIHKDWEGKVETVDNENISSAALTLDEYIVETPWSADEFPTVVQWIEDNEKTLDIFVEASQRSHLYIPLPQTADTPLTYYSTYDIPISKATLALGARAMIRISQKRFEDAWQDLLAIDRIARLFSGLRSKYYYLLSVRFKHHRFAPLVALVSHPELSESKLRRCIEDLVALGPNTTYADLLMAVGRLEELEMLQTYPLYGYDYQMDDDGRPIKNLSAQQQALRNALRASVDWNSILRRYNRIIDELVVALDQPIRPKRFRDVEAILDRHYRKSEILGNPTVANTLFASGTTDKMFAQLMIWTVGTKISQTDAWITVQTRMAEIAARLALYRRVEGEYPESLEKLKEALLGIDPPDADLFDDPFHDTDTLRYERLDNGQGYKIYSVCKNGRDDGGRDETEEVSLIDVPDPRDDFGIRVGPNVFIPRDVWNVDPPEEEEAAETTEAETPVN